MPDSSPDLPLLSLALRADLDVLLGRWGHEPAAAAELPACYARLTDMALASGCRFWLQDLRRRAANDPETTRWLLTEYFPSMSRQLGGRLYVAYLFSPALHQHILQSPDYAPPEAFADRPYSLNFFGDEGAAIQWLQSKQPAPADPTLP